MRSALVSLSLAASSAFAPVATANGSWVVGNQAPSARFVQVCEASLRPTQIILVSPRSAPTYDFGLTVSQLTAYAGKPHNARRVLGLTESQPFFEAKIEGKTVIDDRTGLVCTRPTVTMTISSGSQSVFVAREFPKGSCSHLAIMDHELRHVMVNHAMADRVAHMTKAGLIEYFGQYIFYGSLNAVGQEISMRLEKEWIPWAIGQMRAADKLHMNIDSPEEDIRMRRVCNGEVNLRLSRIK